MEAIESSPRIFHGIGFASIFIVLLQILSNFNTHSVFLNSSSVCAVYDINEGKSLRQILLDYLVHDVRLTNTWTVNYNHAVLKYRE